MIMLQRPSFGAPVAIAYITGGALLDVWSGIWYFYLRNHPSPDNLPQDNTSYYFCTGFLLTGLVLIVIGLALGPIGRSARQAEHHPEILPEEGTRVAVTNPAPVGTGGINGATGITGQGVTSQGPITMAANPPGGNSAGQNIRPDGR